MIFTSFASGSSGNCTFLSTGSENLLIDCGISAKRICDSLKSLGRKITDIDAVLLTHEHIDHVRGLKRLMTAWNIPVYCSAGTWNGLSAALKDCWFTCSGAGLFHPVQADREFYIGNTLICPFRTWHDTEGSLGYRFELEEAVCGHDVNVCVLTDCGVYNEYILGHMKDLDALLIEANHNVEMLMNGPYPMHLKRRILSDRGHSSNEACGKAVRTVYTPRLREVLLAHLSEENNDPETALREVAAAAGIPGLTVSVAPKDRMSHIISL